MAVKSYLIAPFQTGLEKDKQPWLLTEDAFEILEDAYIWRGRLKKRYGYELIGEDYLLSRLRINLGNTGVSPFPAAPTPVPGALPVPNAGQQLFSIGNVILTCNAAGSPATLLSTDGSYSGTFDTATGIYSINHPVIAATPVYYYPGLPVMGLRTRELPTVNQEQTIAFDTQFAYRRTSGGWSRLGSTAASIWTGSDSQFYWTCNARGTQPYDTFLYAVNYKPSDHIKYIDQLATTWTDFRPQLDAGGAPTKFLDTCRILLPFKDRLVALNTQENESASNRIYQNRCRFSQNGDPTNAANSWIDTPGRGGFIDAPIEQAIITAQILKDRLIVYFERSTWELVYTRNKSTPFRWQEINRELGAESPFSQVLFDQGLLGVGNVGIHRCNGVNVERIDEKIPLAVFNIHNGNEGIERVYGIRDFYNEIVLWTFPNATFDTTYPDQILVYNYINNSWAFFNDSFTCFGYFQLIDDRIWSDINEEWQDYNNSWRGPKLQSSALRIAAGNQQGNVVLLDAGLSKNSESFYIYDITIGTDINVKSNNHNLQNGDYVLIKGVQGITSINDKIYLVKFVDINNISLKKDPDVTYTGTYTGGGTLSRVSNLNIWTKKFNPGTPIGQQFNIPYIDFLLFKTEEGQISVNYYIDQFDGNSLRDQDISNALLGTNVLLTSPEPLTPYQEFSEKIWNRFYTHANAQFIQLRFYMSDTQMTDVAISTSNFIMDGMILYAKSEGRLTG